MSKDYPSRSREVNELMKFLKPNPKLQGTQALIAEECFAVAEEMLSVIKEDSAELTTGLRKLLEAKDNFVRASLDL